MTKKNILILGAGGREHALTRKIKDSKHLNKLFVAPGNGGTAEIAENITLDLTDFYEIEKFAIFENIDIIVVGPEAPLVEGISDYFGNQTRLKNIHIVGPVKAGAMLEGSKDYAKSFMQAFKIPTASYRSFSVNEIEEGKQFLNTLQSPYVLKADGLASGKGVLILENLESARQELEEMLNGKFGEASNKVVVEEYLQGIEVSCFCYTDGQSYIMLPEAKDYKRIGENDTGLNTGGMGSISPVPFADEAFMQKVRDQIVEPTIQGLKERGINYHGFIFFGLMNVKGQPYVIEYNVRLGDPEAESVLPRIDSDLIEMFEAGCNKNLDQYRLQISDRYAAAVMLVSGGYPGQYEKGKTITGINQVSDSIVLQAGTKLQQNNLLTSGGRVLAITSLNNSMQKAIDMSLNNAEIINFEKKYYRKDIGFDLI